MILNQVNRFSVLKEVYDLLDGMKRYLRIEHQDDDKELLEYLRKQAGLHPGIVFWGPDYFPYLK